MYSYAAYHYSMPDKEGEIGKDLTAPPPHSVLLISVVTWLHLHFEGCSACPPSLYFLISSTSHEHLTVSKEGESESERAQSCSDFFFISGNSAYDMAAATNQAFLINKGEEGYIDMEVRPFSPPHFSYCSISSPPQSREFEFQMSTPVPREGVATTSPADELFYKGKLLPLHLPPRLQMVRKLLQNSPASPFESKSEPLEENSLTLSTTPLESCSISPSESCRVSGEINPDDYFFEWSAESRSFIGETKYSKKSWAKKLKQIKQSSMKASRLFLKSLFSKSACSDESCAKAACNAEEDRSVLRIRDCLDRYMKASRRNPFPFGKFDRQLADDGAHVHRKSFSGVIQRHSPSKSSSISTSSSGSSSSSSSFSFGSNSLYDLQLLKRSSSANSEVESSIEGAIAHCKQSQHFSSNDPPPRKFVSGLGISAPPAAVVVAAEREEKLELCA